MTRVGAEKAGAAPGRARAPRFGDRSSLCGAPSTAWTFWTSFFLLFFLVPLALAPPPAVISMTHKPNILASNFTHQNKDEKNFVDTVVLRGVFP